MGRPDVPGSAMSLLEYRLGQAGHDAMGFAVHVPHYLARAAYPQAARVLLDHVGLAAGLFLPTESLSAAAERTEREIAEQVAKSSSIAGRAAALSDAVEHWCAALDPDGDYGFAVRGISTAGVRSAA